MFLASFLVLVKKFELVIPQQSENRDSCHVLEKLAILSQTSQGSLAHESPVTKPWVWVGYASSRTNPGPNFKCPETSE